MVLSDKKFIEFSEQVWERNKELLAEKRELLDEVRYFKELAFDRADEIEKLRNENGALRKDLEEANSRCNEVMDKQYERIRELERKNAGVEPEDEEMEERGDHCICNISLDWDDLFEDCEDDLEDSDRFINCTFNFNFN